MLIGRSETICQLESCTFIMDKLLGWQQLENTTADSVKLVKELGSELIGYMLELTRNLKRCRLEEKEAK